MTEIEYKKGYGRLINYLVIGGEFLLLNSLFILSIYLCKDYLTDEILSNWRILILLLNVAYFPTLFLNYQKFHEQRILVSHFLIKRTFKITLLLFISYSTLLLFLKIEDLSRLFLLSFCGVYFIVLSCWWLLIWSLLKTYRRKGHNFKNVLFVGMDDNIDMLIDNLSSEEEYGYRLLGYFNSLPMQKLSRVPYLGNLYEIFLFFQKTKIDELYCALPEKEQEFILKLNEYCENHMVRFFYVPSIAPNLVRHMKLEMIGNSPVMVNRREPLNDFFARFLKRIFDLVLSSIMVLLSPIWFLPIALFVKISSPGPIIFKQLRTGRSGKNFYCYKFRSMRVNDISDKAQATRNDPRKTKIGDFLRRTNLDELPQIFNIFKGDMSFVGPRPHMLKHTEDYSQEIDKYMVRHFVKPGLTGWAQINGYRGETKEKWQMQKRIDCDIWYLENWSFWLDMKIIAKTGYNMFKHDENAF